MQVSDTAKTCLSRKSTKLIYIVILFAITISVPVAASSLSSNLVSQGWEEITFDGKQENRFSACGQNCVEVETKSSVSMIGKQSSNNLVDTPILNWQWRIENPVTLSNLEIKGEDDRAVAIYVTFPYDPNTATFIEKLSRPIFELFRGPDTPSRMLSYVWGGLGNPGDLIESPYFGGVNAIFINRNKNDPVGKWVVERVDVVADHKRALGFAPNAISHILIGADSDDTETTNRATVRDIKFTAK